MITDHWPSASDNARVSSVVTPVPTGESGTHGDTNSDLPTPRQTAELQEWAKDATARGVIIRNAGKDARVVLGTSAPTEDEASEELRKRSEEHTSELQSLMRISYAVFCLKTKN